MTYGVTTVWQWGTQGRRLQKVAVAAAGLMVSLTSALPAGAAGPLWLDGAAKGWNTAGAPVPAAPSRNSPIPQRCDVQERPANAPEEEQLTAKGWRLVNYWTPQRRDNVLVVLATSFYDGMCRPWAYNGFVFVDDVFAGTISPNHMESRIDGAVKDQPSFSAGGVLEASFTRYAERDPLCCPSLGATRVTYRIDGAQSSRVVTPETITAVPPAAPSMPGQLPSTGDSLPDAGTVAALGSVMLAAGALALRRTKRGLSAEG